MQPTIDLSKLPAPTIIEEVEYEKILQSMKEFLISLDSSLENVLKIESEPLVKLLEVFAYREFLIRAKINQDLKAVMLPYSSGKDLDNLVAFYNIERLVINEGDPNTIPPTPPTFEDDERLRKRALLSLEGYSTAGPEKAYIFHAFNASTEVSDVKVLSPSPGSVKVIIASNDENSLASTELINKVQEYLTNEDVRPLTDFVEVQSVDIIEYEIKANIKFYNGPDPELVLTQIHKNIKQFIAESKKIGKNIVLSAIYSKLHIEGVESVEIISPNDSINVEDTKIAYCSNIDIKEVK